MRWYYEKTISSARIEVCIDPKIKSKAQEELSKYGMTISEYVRATITTVATQGLPKDFGIPNAEVMRSLYEIRDNQNSETKMKGFTSVKSLMNDLDDD